MARLSDEAFAVVAGCPKVKQLYGITVNRCGYNYRLMWSFKISKEAAKREGYDKKTVKGAIDYDADYPGCPYCGSKQFYVCGNCGKLVCYYGEEKVTCPMCGYSSGVQMVEEIDLTGGGF